MLPIATAFDLTPHNTLGLRATASHAVRLQRADSLAADLHQLRTDPALAGLPWLVLGGGSNLVIGHDLRALVLKNELLGRTITARDNDHVFVRAMGGENWHDFVMWTLEQGLSGLENLALIPGCVGASPVQNIGAYGLEVMERIWQVETLDLATGAPRVFSAEECRFSYRDSIFKQEWAGRLLITAVVFRLPARFEARLGYGEVAREVAELTPTPTPRAVAEAVIRIRRAKLPDPAQIGNAGSFFKNPVVPDGSAAALKNSHPALPVYEAGPGMKKLAAGWLIDQAGWKGKRLGPAGMYEKQALCLVNHGGATGDDVARVSKAVQADVLRIFGVALETEPVTWA